MKKLMTLMLGLALVTGTVAVTFAQDTKSDSTMKKKGGKKGGKKKKGDGAYLEERFPLILSNCWDAARSARGATRGFSGNCPFL